MGDYNDPYTFLQYLKSDFGINLPHYSSAEYDALLDSTPRGRPTSPGAARCSNRRNASRSPTTR